MKIGEELSSRFFDRNVWLVGGFNPSENISQWERLSHITMEKMFETTNQVMYHQFSQSLGPGIYVQQKLWQIWLRSIQIWSVGFLRLRNPSVWGLRFVAVSILCLQHQFSLSAVLFLLRLYFFGMPHVWTNPYLTLLVQSQRGLSLGGLILQTVGISSYIWVNDNISLTWILRPYWDDFPNPNHHSQWGRSEVVIKFTQIVNPINIH